MTTPRARQRLERRLRLLFAFERATRRAVDFIVDSHAFFWRTVYAELMDADDETVRLAAAILDASEHSADETEVEETN
jgi:hypothetical protein